MTILPLRRSSIACSMVPKVIMPRELGTGNPENGEQGRQHPRSEATRRPVPRCTFPFPSIKCFTSFRSRRPRDGLDPRFGGCLKSCAVRLRNQRDLNDARGRQGITVRLTPSTVAEPRGMEARIPPAGPRCPPAGHRRLPEPRIRPIRPVFDRKRLNVHVYRRQPQWNSKELNYPGLSDARRCESRANRQC